MRPRGHRAEAGSMRTLAIVRRGAAERFQVLQKTFAGDPVEIIWDRRAGERRQHRSPVMTDWRRSDRREVPPVTWTALDFVVVHVADRREGREEATA